MLFNSLTFLYVFLPVSHFVFWRLRTRSQRYVWLTLTGYVFYGFWNYRFCALMAFSTAVSYLAGRGLATWSDPRRRKLCLVLPVVVDLSLLGVFKYTNFVLTTAGALSVWLHVPVHLPKLDIILPVGISFYTFHTITYIVDCYRGVITPTRNFFEFSTYVSLFAQLVAGPIVRFGQIEYDLEHIDRADRAALRDSGWSFLAIGMFKKVLIADTIAAQINPALQNWAQLSTTSAWLVVFGYTYQLYFDFSGYSDMAVGLGRLFGLRLPQNFHSPYRALDIADFWRRWHISLSSVLRDYLYIPLGGNRQGTLRTYRNLLITMLLGGLWHGANWTFVIWGGYHGGLLALHRLWGSGWARLPSFVQRLGTFFLVVIGWVIFRADDWMMARGLLRSLFVWRGDPSLGGWLLPTMLALAAGIAHLLPNTFELRHQWRPSVAIGIALAFASCLVRMYSGSQSPFLYFQF